MFYRACVTLDTDAKRQDFYAIVRAQSHLHSLWEGGQFDGFPALDNTLTGRAARFNSPKSDHSQKPSFTNKRVLTFLRTTVYNSTLVLHICKALSLADCLVGMKESAVVAGVNGDPTMGQDQLLRREAGAELWRSCTSMRRLTMVV